MHALVRIGDSHVMMNDEFPEMGDASVRSPASLGSTTCVMNVYCNDADAWFQRAVAAGAKAKMPPADMFWGDRYGQVVDPFGHVWAIATRVEDITPAEAQARAEKWMVESAAGKKPG
jgi:uncharacterized glyoxalase superfamily protein PhnB